MGSKTLAKETADPLCVLFCTSVGAIIALPSVFGSNCWLTFIGFTTTPTGLWLCHAFQFTLLLSILSNLVQYYACLGLSQFGTLHEALLGPVSCIAFAALLLMVDPAFYLFEDLKIITSRQPSARGALALRGCARLGLALLACGGAWAARRLRRGGGRLPGSGGCQL